MQWFDKNIHAEPPARGREAAIMPSLVFQCCVRLPIVDKFQLGAPAPLARDADAGIP